MKLSFSKAIGKGPFSAMWEARDENGDHRFSAFKDVADYITDLQDALSKKDEEQSKHRAYWEQENQTLRKRIKEIQDARNENWLLRQANDHFRERLVKAEGGEDPQVAARKIQSKLDQEQIVSKGLRMEIEMLKKQVDLLQAAVKSYEGGQKPLEGQVLGHSFVLHVPEGTTQGKMQKILKAAIQQVDRTRQFECVVAVDSLRWVAKSHADMVRVLSDYIREQRIKGFSAVHSEANKRNADEREEVIRRLQGQVTSLQSRLDLANASSANWMNRTQEVTKKHDLLRQDLIASNAANVRHQWRIADLEKEIKGLKAATPVNVQEVVEATKQVATEAEKIAVTAGTFHGEVKDAAHKHRTSGISCTLLNDLDLAMRRFDMAIAPTQPPVSTGDPVKMDKHDKMYEQGREALKAFDSYLRQNKGALRSSLGLPPTTKPLAGPPVAPAEASC